MNRKPDKRKAANAREVALDVLVQVIHKKQPLDQVLETALAGSRLSPRDRAFAHQLVYLVMRRLGSLKHVLNRIVNKPISKQASRTSTTVLMGIAQILFMRTSDHAAVSESVDLIARSPHPKERGMKGLVNALLRRVVRERDAWLAEVDERPEADIAGPFRRRVTDRFGEDIAADLGKTMRFEPPLDISLKPGEDIAEHASLMGGKVMPGGTIRRDFTDVTGLPGFDDGIWWVQDLAASLPVKLLPENLNDTHVLDMCAAPGGKTLQLASRGARVTAVDRSGNRMKRLEANLERTGLAAGIAVADATSFKPAESVDHILLDAPCTATGTFRRNPDVLWNRTPDDIEKLAALQSALLDHAFSLLPVGGTLVYCVCSMEAEEGPDQMIAFLERQPAARRMPVEPAEIPGLDMTLTPDGDLAPLPSMLTEDGGMDGFFIARLTRIR